MPTLNELLSGGNSGNATIFTTNNIAVEPLDGPTSVEDVMDRFPEEVYQQGRDSHLFRLLAALCGDAGAGLAKKQAYAARLRFEAEFVNFRVLDKLYVAQFTFHRLRRETYDYDVDVDGLTPTQWDEVQLSDQSYYHRMQEWWTATRHGNAPEGMRLAAQAGIGIDCDVVEHYKYLFDQLSDLKLNIAPVGQTISTNEFVIVPRFLNANDVAYESYLEKKFVFPPVTLDPSERPVVPPPELDGGPVLPPVPEYQPPLPAFIQLVSHSSGIGSSVTLPAHRPGDLIVISAARMWHEPTAPSAGGTVPTWTKQVSLQSNLAWLATFTTVATTNAHTSGNFGSNVAFTTAVFRAVNGTIGVGYIPVPTAAPLPYDPTPNPIPTPINRLAPNAPNQMIPQMQVPNWVDGGNTSSGNYFAASVSAVVTNQLQDNILAFDPIEYVDGDQATEEVPLTHAIPACANFWRGRPLPDGAPVTTMKISDGPHMGAVTNGLEITVTPDPAIIIPPPEDDEERRDEEDETPTPGDEYTDPGTYIVREPFWRLLPDLERNAVDMLDRLRPASTVVTFRPEPTRYSEISLLQYPVASSERLNVNRYVTGSATVPWPEADPASNFFILSGSEAEASYYYGMNRDLPIIFLTVENAYAYSDNALGDPTYGTGDFFESVDGISPFELYKSEQAGNYFPVISALFPFVTIASSDTVFDANQAIANQNTTLIMEGQIVPG